jgi:hypothetical protein
VSFCLPLARRPEWLQSSELSSTSIEVVRSKAR